MISSTFSSRSSSPSPSHVLQGSAMQTQLEEDAFPSRPYSPSLLSSHALSNEENRWHAVIEERDAEIARLQNENLRLVLEREGEGRVIPTFSVMEVSSNLGDVARRLRAQNQGFGQTPFQDTIQEPSQRGESSEANSTASASTSLRDEARRQANYQAISSNSNNSLQGSSNALGGDSSVSVGISQNPYITINPEDIELLQKTLRIYYTPEQIQIFLENRPDLLPILDKLREVQDSLVKSLIGCGVSLSASFLFILSSDSKNYLTCLYMMSFCTMIGLAFFLAAVNASTEKQKIVDRLNYYERLPV